MIRISQSIVIDKSKFNYNFSCDIQIIEYILKLFNFEL